MEQIRVGLKGDTALIRTLSDEIADAVRDHGTALPDEQYDYGRVFQLPDELFDEVTRYASDESLKYRYGIPYYCHRGYWLRRTNPLPSSLDDLRYIRYRP